MQDSCNEANTPDHTSTTQALVVTETPVEGKEEEDKNVDILADLFEKLYILNKKLEEQEDDIFRLTVQMEAMVTTKQSTGLDSMTAEHGNVLHTEVTIAREELDTMAKLNSRLGYEIKRNELALSNMMKNYDGRQQFARRLEADVNQVEAAQSGGAHNPNNNPSHKQSLKKIEVSQSEREEA